MNNTRRALGILTAAVTAVAALPATGQLPDTPERGALVRLDEELQWSGGGRFAVGKRDLVIPGQSGHIHINTLSAAATLQLDVLSWAALFAEAGWIQATRGEEDGEGGLQGGAGADLNLFEGVFDASPEAGRKGSLTLNTIVAYRRYESNFPDHPFEWGEWTVEPALAYRVNYRSDLIEHQGLGDIFAIRAGLRYSDISGEFGNDNIEEQRNFGALGGVEVGFSHNVFISLSGVYYSGSDNEIALTLKQAW